jgi:hypothetical protein
MTREQFIDRFLRYLKPRVRSLELMGDVMITVVHDGVDGNGDVFGPAGLIPVNANITLPNPGTLREKQ